MQKKKKKSMSISNNKISNQTNRLVLDLNPKLLAELASLPKINPSILATSILA
jgi:hypothetical protein